MSANGKPKRVAIYARVSTDRQDAGMQLDELARIAEARGWETVGPEYVHIVLGEDGSEISRTVFPHAYVDVMSGKKELVDRRPMLQQLMADAGRQKFDVVLVWKFDRFARSTKHLIEALERFESLQIDFVSITEQIDTSTATGRMVFTVLGAIAEFERELTRERVITGLRRAVAQGKRLGRPRVSVNARRVAEFRAQGRSWSEICSEMRVSKGSAQRAFYSLPKNPAASARASA